MRNPENVHTSTHHHHLLGVKIPQSDVAHCHKVSLLFEYGVERLEAVGLLRPALVVELRCKRLQDLREVSFPHRRLAQDEDGSLNGRHRRRGRLNHFNRRAIAAAFRLKISELLPDRDEMRPFYMAFT